MPNTQWAEHYCRLKAFLTSEALGSCAKLHRKVRLKSKIRLPAQARIAVTSACA